MVFKSCVIVHKSVKFLESFMFLLSLGNKSLYMELIKLLEIKIRYLNLLMVISSGDYIREKIFQRILKQNFIFSETSNMHWVKDSSIWTIYSSIWNTIIIRCFILLNTKTKLYLPPQTRMLKFEPPMYLYFVSVFEKMVYVK